MFQWVPYAFVRIVLFFIGGILVGIYQPRLVTEYQAALSLVVLTLAFFVLAGWRAVNPGPVGLSAVFVAGYLNLYYHTDSTDARHFLHAAQPTQYYKVVLIKPAKERANSWQQEARVLAIQTEAEGWHARHGKVLLYFLKADFNKPFTYGDEVIIRGSPSLIEPPANPGEFDYRRFLGFRNIYHQHFLRKDHVLHSQSTHGNLIFSTAYRLRANAQHVLSTHIEGRQQQAIASALILGVTDGLDNELTQAYAASGAMHVLAVSGLHVGIIYGIVLLLLRPLNRTRKGKWSIAGISIVLLWAYALITGLSPSVLRAVTMFSFVALARPLNYRTNIYNTLAVSAFCLLLANPYLVMSVGFQLSYLAVLGIVYLQPRLYNLWTPKSLLWDKTWQITCVSLAAQAATFPLGLLYFHQFPVYFLFSNLFVIPGAVTILITGILLLAGSSMAGIAGAIGFILTWLIKTLNYLVFTIERLPFSIIDNIYISTFQCWLIMALAASVILLIQHRKFNYVIAAALAATLFGGVQWQHHVKEIKPDKFIVYRVPGYRALEFTGNGQSHFYADTSLIKNHERMRFHIRPNRLLSGVARTRVNDSLRMFSPQRGVAVYTWHTKLIVQTSNPEFYLPAGLTIDYLIISNNAVKNLDQIKDLKINTLVIDSSNSLPAATRLIAEAKSRSLNVYSVLHSGAYINHIRT